ncbi:hypothetical protein [Burkholderia ambifaria]|nr:hypothetical protein [Burkholderia ambifaria]
MGKIALLPLLSLPSLSYGIDFQTTMVAGYDSCKWTDVSPDTVELSVNISFRGGLVSPLMRAIYLYRYDKNGKPTYFSGISSVVKDGSNGVVRYGLNYTRVSNTEGSWGNRTEHTANFTIRLQSSQVAAWPAITVRGGSYNTSQQLEWGDIQGGAYIARNGSNGACIVIPDPENPPPLPIAIGMTAPDWSLGELQRGDNQKILSNISDQLCFTYSGGAVSGKGFIINASSANGIVNNRYRLKNSTDVSQMVPYSVTLDSGTSILSLPNTNNTSLYLNSNGRTCFTPTFRTTVSDSVKEGDYSDVLTFTVVTKS